MVFEIGSKKVAKFGWFSELYQDGNHNVDKINVRYHYSSISKDSPLRYVRSK